MAVRVRFAPSPTGYLHIGGARTALYNWLFARHSGGTFILRIEDTDAARSSEEMVRGILDGMSWLGLNWDEGPFFQSERLTLYQSTAQSLLLRGRAYRCFCSGEDSSEDIGSGGGSDPCRHLTDQVAAARAASEPFGIRFRVPHGEALVFEDGVFGKIEVQSENIEDFIVLRSDQTPTYHLSVVADDIEMGVTHVIRGADHIPNTAKQILLYKALEKTVPVFAHLPLILGPDKKRLSKRHGATSVLEYREMGFLPQAVRNYLALLGWSPGNDQEFFEAGELERLFSLDRINRANAVFDLQKLEWMNGRLMSQLDASELAPEVRRVLENSGLWQPKWEDEQSAWFLRTIDLLKKGARRVTDFAEQGRAFFSDDFDYQPEGIEKYLQPEAEENEGLREAVQILIESYQTLEPFDLAGTETVLRTTAERTGLKAGKLIGAVRVATTGRANAPGIFEVLCTLGRVRTLARLERLADFLAR